jgi:ribosomal protein L37AE/L43A
MKTSNPTQQNDGVEIVRIWTLADGTRCTLAMVGDGLEMRIIHDAAIVRRSSCVDVRLFRYVAETWRVEYEMAHAPARTTADTVCPECGEEALVKRGSSDKHWLGCGSCGNVWVDETDAQSRRA